MSSSLSSRRQYRARGSLEKTPCLGLKPYARRAISPGLCAEEGLVQKEDVERNDEEDHDRRNGRGETVVDERAHNVPVTAEDQQRNERERDAEGEHHLAYYQRTAGVEANAQDVIRAGIIVTRRRKNSGICRLMNPCMTTCPLRVPTEELDSPEASRATPNRMAGVLP